jgi:hypothetical protein
MTTLHSPEERCRQEFEAWSLGGLPLYRDDGGKYMYPRVQSRWEAWQAAFRLYAPPLPEPEPSDPAEVFCDANCCWSWHHPDCVRHDPAEIGTPQ